MKIAVTYENGEVFQHFGHSEHFKIYDVSGGKVASARVVDTEGSDHGALAGFLAERWVDTLLCGGIGGGAKAALAEARIAVYGGVTGLADAALEAFLQGALRYDADAACSHHGHEGGHSCGGHEDGHSCGHGGHSCGGRE